MHNRNNEETVAVIRQPSKSIVPREESTEEGEEPACLGELGVRHSHRVALHVGKCEEENGEVDEEEEGEECEGGSNGEEGYYRGEDEPTLLILPP